MSQPEPAGSVLPRLPVALSFASFILIGASDGANGVLIPSLQTQYGIDKGTLSLVFLSGTAGYLSAAFSSGPLVAALGLRRLLLLAGATFALGAGIMSLTPPFLALIPGLLLIGFGAGILDAGLNAYIAGLPRSAPILNFLHAFYGAGALLGPLVATAVLTLGGPWSRVYFLWVLVAIVVLIGCGLVFPGRPPAIPGESGGGLLAGALRQRVIWLGALFLLIYVGTEVSVGGWSYSLLTETRHAPTVLAGWAVSGYWAGLTVGRIVLGALSNQVGAERLIQGCLGGVAAGVLLLWGSQGMVLNAAGLALIGFSLGPIFPTTIALLSTRVPARLLPSGIGFVASAASMGAALLFWVAGTLADHFGLPAVLPYVLGLTVLLIAVWLALSATPRPAAAEGNKAPPVGV